MKIPIINIIIVIGFNCLTIILAVHVRIDHDRLGHHQKKYGANELRSKPLHTNKHSQEGETVIENKNVNIVVNVDPKDVATELWKLIEEHLDLPTRRSFLTDNYINDIEKIVVPIILPTRRLQTSPFHIADALDRITRRALNNNSNVNINTNGSIDQEILTRDIVIKMMKKLKLITKKKYNKHDDYDDDDHDDDDDDDDYSRRKMQKNKQDDDEYITFNMRLLKSSLVDIL